MAYLEDYDALAASGKPAGDIALGQIGLVLGAVGQHPNEFFAELRAQRPIFNTPLGTIVTHHRDVTDVLELDHIFGVAPYAVAMTRNNEGRNFILGREQGPEFEREKSLLKTVIRQTDLEAIRAFVAERAAAVIGEAAPSGRLDLANPYGYRIPTEMAVWYFGVPTDDVPEMMVWIHAIFLDMFLNLAGDPKVTEAANAAGKRLIAHVERGIAAAHAGETDAGAFDGNVLGRLVALQAASDDAFDDVETRVNVIGCLVGVVDNTVEAVIRVVDVLLDRPGDLAGAVAAATAGDDELLRRYCWEALRFHTPAPFLVRVSTQPHVLAKGTPRETTVPAGTTVFAANSSAMMDDTVVDAPGEFRVDRPRHHYMHFGHGMHECLGKHINTVQITELVKAVLVLPGLRRSGEDGGQPVFDGSSAVRFVIEFDAMPAQ